MSSTMKLSLLALVSTAAAIPHYGAHSKFHSLKPSGTEGYGHGHHGTGKPYPTAGWQGYNATAAPYPTETADYNDEQPKTIDVTSTSTLTITSTIHVKPSSAAANKAEASSVVVADYAASSPAGVCAPPKTVTVTAAEKVTITVGEGDEKPYTPAPQPSEGYALLSSAAPAEKPSTPAAQYPAETPKPETPSSQKAEPYVAPTSAAAPVYSAAPPAPVYSSAVAPSAAPVYSSAVAPSAAPVYSSAAPSATPPSTGNSYNGVKRGLVYNDASLCKTLGGKFGFGHNWAQVENNDIGTMFIPTMHGPTKGTVPEWLANVDKAVKKGSTAVQGFNECDHPDQCALAPEAACAAWKEFMNPVKAKYPQLTILGPSVTNGAAPMGLTWLDGFHKACPDASVDATNIHFYDIYQEANPSIGQSSTLDRFKAHVKQAADSYGQKVWITEFGLNPGSASPEQAAKFLEGAMAYLDGADYVQGYSWYKVGNGATELNAALGQAYAAAS